MFALVETTSAELSNLVSSFTEKIVKLKTHHLSSTPPTDPTELEAGISNELLRLCEVLDSYSRQLREKVQAHPRSPAEGLRSVESPINTVNVNPAHSSRRFSFWSMVRAPEPHSIISNSNLPSASLPHLPALSSNLVGQHAILPRVNSTGSLPARRGSTFSDGEDTVFGSPEGHEEERLIRDSISRAYRRRSTGFYLTGMPEFYLEQTDADRLQFSRKTTRHTAVLRRLPDVRQTLAGLNIPFCEDIDAVDFFPSRGCRLTSDQISTPFDPDLHSLSFNPSASAQASICSTAALPNALLIERDLHSLNSVLTPLDDSQYIFAVTALNTIFRYSFWEPDRLRLDRYKLVNFICAIALEYRVDNPFNNAFHAADALHSAHLFLLQPGVKENLTDLEIFSLLFAVAVRGAGHLGVDDEFLRKVGHVTSCFYFEEESLNLACAVAFSLLRLPQNNFFPQDLNVSARPPNVEPGHPTATDWEGFREFSLQLLILSGNSSNDELKSNLEEIQSMGVTDEAHLRYLLAAVIRAANYGSFLRGPAIAVEWFGRQTAEFYRQGAAEIDLLSRGGRGGEVVEKMIPLMTSPRHLMTASLALYWNGVLMEVIAPLLQILSGPTVDLWLKQLHRTSSFLHAHSNEKKNSLAAAAAQPPPQLQQESSCSSSIPTSGTQHRLSGSMSSSTSLVSPQGFGFSANSSTPPAYLRHLKLADKVILRYASKFIDVDCWPSVRKDQQWSAAQMMPSVLYTIISSGLGLKAGMNRVLAQGHSSFISSSGGPPKRGGGGDQRAAGNVNPRGEIHGNKALDEGNQSSLLTVRPSARPQNITRAILMIVLKMIDHITGSVGGGGTKHSRTKEEESMTTSTPGRDKSSLLRNHQVNGMQKYRSNNSNSLLCVQERIMTFAKEWIQDLFLIEKKTSQALLVPTRRGAPPLRAAAIAAASRAEFQQGIRKLNNTSAIIANAASHHPQLSPRHAFHRTSLGASSENSNPRHILRRPSHQDGDENDENKEDESASNELDDFLSVDLFRALLWPPANPQSQQQDSSEGQMDGNANNGSKLKRPNTSPVGGKAAAAAVQSDLSPMWMTRGGTPQHKNTAVHNNISTMAGTPLPGVPVLNNTALKAAGEPVLDDLELFLQGKVDSLSASMARVVAQKMTLLWYKVQLNQQ